MKVAILIHVHTNPAQVARLVSCLKHDEIDIYINVDAKVDISEYKDSIYSALFIKNRVEVIWGRFSQVQQILNSFHEIINTKINYSHILFISGLDYPVKPISEILRILKQNQGNSYIDYLELGTDDWSVLMKKRYQYWYFLPKNDWRNNELIKKLLLKIGFRRSYPFKKVYYGSCWFCLSLEAVKYILNYTNQNPKFVKFSQHTGCVDELYFQSILLNSSLKEKMINSIYRYIDWTSKEKSPKVLTEIDFLPIKDSGAWFARKIDMNIDSKLMDMLDELNGVNNKLE